MNKDRIELRIRLVQGLISAAEYTAQLGGHLTRKVAENKERRQLKGESIKMDRDFEGAGFPTKGSEPASDFDPEA